MRKLLLFMTVIVIITATASLSYAQVNLQGSSSGTEGVVLGEEIGQLLWTNDSLWTKIISNYPQQIIVDHIFLGTFSSNDGIDFGGLGDITHPQLGTMRFRMTDRFRWNTTRNGERMTFENGELNINGSIACTPANGLCGGGGGVDNYDEVSGWNFTDYVFANRFLTNPDGGMYINLYDDGSNIVLNASEVEDEFQIETENSVMSLFNEPKAANDYKVFQIFSNQAQTQTEFTITKAGTAHTSYFVRSLALVGNGSQTGSDPWNMSEYAEYVDARTDLTGADLYVIDDIESNGTIYAKEDVRVNNVSVVTVNDNDDCITLSFAASATSDNYMGWNNAFNPCTTTWCFNATKDGYVRSINVLSAALTSFGTNKYNFTARIKGKDIAANGVHLAVSNFAVAGNSTRYGRGVHNFSDGVMVALYRDRYAGAQTGNHGATLEICYYDE